MNKDGLQRCKYFDKLGIPIENYGTNFCDKSDKRWKRWMKQRKKYGFDDRETWNLDQMFYEWIYTRFMMYKEVSIADLKYNKIKLENGKKISLDEAIDIVIEGCKKIILGESHKLDDSLPHEVWEVLEKVMPYMWW